MKGEMVEIPTQDYKLTVKFHDIRYQGRAVIFSSSQAEENKKNTVQKDFVDIIKYHACSRWRCIVFEGDIKKKYVIKFSIIAGADYHTTFVVSTIKLCLPEQLVFLQIGRIWLAKWQNGRYMIIWHCFSGDSRKSWEYHHLP